MMVSEEITSPLCCFGKSALYSATIALLKPPAAPTYAERQRQATNVAALNTLLRTYRTGIEAAAVAGSEWKRIIIQIFEGTAEEIRAVLGKSPDGVILEFTDHRQNPA